MAFRNEEEQYNQNWTQRMVYIFEALKVRISVWSSRDNQDKNVHLSQENPVKNVQ